MNEHILMIHGMWCGDWVWDSFKGFFESKGYHCITPTLRHHDKKHGAVSHDRIGTTSLLDYAEDLENEICRLDRKPILMGHSMGGILAQILGSRGLAKALVLLTPAAPRGIVALKPSVIRCFWSVMKKPGFWKKPMLPTFDEAVYAALQLFPVQEQRELYERLVPESGRAGFELGFWLLDRRRASGVDARRVTCPTLVIAGALDNITPSSVVRRVADKYGPVATFREFRNHAHWVIGEPGWQEIAEYGSEWLSEVLARMPERPRPPSIRVSRPYERAKKMVSDLAARWSPPEPSDRRAHPRVEIDMGVEASIPYSGNAHYYDVGHTVNVSRGGLFLNTDITVREGAFVNLQLIAREAERPVWVQGRVVRSLGKGVAMSFSHTEKARLNMLLPL